MLILIRMGGLVRLCILVLVTLLLCRFSSGLLRKPSGIIRVSKNLFVTNDLSPGTPLNIHCWSKDNDFGYRILHYKEDVEWDFNDSWIHVTRFTCDMNFVDAEQKRISGQFVIYHAAKSIGKCHVCKWSVRFDALYLYRDKYDKDGYVPTEYWQNTSNNQM